MPAAKAVLRVFDHVFGLIGFLFASVLIALNWYAISAWLSFDPDALNPPPNKTTNPPPNAAEASAAFLGAWRKDWLERPTTGAAERTAVEEHRDARDELSNIAVSDCAWTRLTELATPPESRNRVGPLPKGAYRCQVKVSFLAKRLGDVPPTKVTQGYFYRDDQDALHYVGQFPH